MNISDFAISLPNCPPRNWRSIMPKAMNIGYPQGKDGLPALWTPSRSPDTGLGSHPCQGDPLHTPTGFELGLARGREVLEIFN